MKVAETVDRRAGALALGLIRTGFFLPLLVCTYLALIPDTPDNAVFRLGDVLLHAAAFTYLTFALCLMLIADSREAFPAPAVRVFLLMLGYGIFLEVAQGFIPERSAELKDLVVDTFGIVLGLMLAALLARPAVRLVRFLTIRAVTLLDR